MSSGPVALIHPGSWSTPRSYLNALLLTWFAQCLEAKIAIADHLHVILLVHVPVPGPFSFSSASMSGIFYL